MTPSELAAATRLEVTTDEEALNAADAVVVAVPTPIDDAYQPASEPLISANGAVGRNLRQRAVVVFESTVYPGAIEEVCVPVRITKVVSGDTPETLEKVAAI